MAELTPCFNSFTVDIWYMLKNVLSARKEKGEPEKRGFLVRSKWTLGFEDSHSLTFFVAHNPEGKLPQHQGLRFVRASESPDSPLSSAISRYAGGGFGIVKKAIDTEGRLWALKILHLQSSSSAKSSKAIDQYLLDIAQQEVFAWRTLGRDACYFILDPTEETITSRFYLLMPWLNGCELFDYVKEQPEHALTLEICHIVFRDVIQQLIRLKEVNCLHSDIKFENIFFDATTQTATLLDFSLCAIGASPQTITEAYLSPDYTARFKEARRQAAKEKTSARLPCYNEEDALYALGHIAESMSKYGFRDIREKNRAINFLNMIINYCKEANCLGGTFDDFAQMIEIHIEIAKRKERKKERRYTLFPVVASSSSLNSTSNQASPEQRGDTLTTTTEDSVDRRRSLTGYSPKQESNNAPALGGGSFTSFH